MSKKTDMQTETKTADLKFRIKPSSKSNFIESANNLFPEKKGKNGAIYLDYLMSLDNESAQKVLSGTDRALIRELKSEIRLFIYQLSRIGSSANQIAHSLNIIKNKKYTTVEDKRALDKHYGILQNIDKKLDLSKSIMQDIEDTTAKLHKS